MGRTVAMVVGWMAIGCVHLPPPEGADVPSAEMEALKTQNAELASRVTEQGGHIAELELALDRCSVGTNDDDSALEACADAKDGLRAQLARATWERDEARERLSELDRRPSVEAHQHALARIEDLERQLLAQPSPEALARARARIVDLEHALASAPTPEEVQRARVRTQRLRSELGAARSELVALAGVRDQLQQARGTLHDLKRQLGLAERSAADRAERLNRARVQLDERNARIAQLENRLAAARVRIEQLEAVPAPGRPRPPGGAGNLRAELEEARARVAELERELEGRPTTDELSQARERVVALRERVDNLKAKLERARGRIAQLEGRAG